MPPSLLNAVQNTNASDQHLPKEPPPPFNSPIKFTAADRTLEEALRQLETLDHRPLRQASSTNPSSAPIDEWDAFFLPSYEQRTPTIQPASVQPVKITIAPVAPRQPPSSPPLTTKPSQQTAGAAANIGTPPQTPASQKTAVPAQENPEKVIAKLESIKVAQAANAAKVRSEALKAQNAPLQPPSSPTDNKMRILEALKKNAAAQTSLKAPPPAPVPATAKPVLDIKNPQASTIPKAPAAQTPPIPPTKPSLAQAPTNAQTTNPTMEFSADRQVLSDKDVAAAVEVELTRDISDIFPPKTFMGFGQSSGLETKEWDTVRQMPLADIMSTKGPLSGAVTVSTEQIVRLQSYLRALEKQSALTLAKREKMVLENYIRSALGNVIAPTIRS